MHLSAEFMRHEVHTEHAPKQLFVFRTPQVLGHVELRPDL